MNRCKNCNLEVRDDTLVCPLCKSILAKEGKEVENKYPDVVEKLRMLQLASRIYLFFAILLEALLIYLNLRYLPGFFWSVIPGYLLLCGYLTFVYLLSGNRTSYSMDIIFAAAALIGLLDMADRILGNRGWAMNYVQPSILIFFDLVILAFVLGSPRTWQSYLVTQLVVFLMSLGAIPLFLMGLVDHPLLSVIAMLITAGSFFGTFLIGGGRAREELKRRFHL
ncbi:MAG: DUF6320 domain-containing protein [Lachnospiraceae bacterium]